MASWGSGFAQGLSAGSTMGRNILAAYDWGSELDKRRKKEDIAKETLGQVGQPTVESASSDEAGDMPVQGAPLTQEQGLRNYASRVAGLDPLESVRLSGEADNIALRGLQRKQAERTERTNSLNEQLGELRRFIAAGGDPQQGYRKLWTLNKDVPNGYSSNIFTFNGQPHISLQQDGSPEAQAFPLTPETMMKAIDVFERSLMSTKDRATLGLQERQVGVSERNANTNEQYRRDMIDYYGKKLDADSKYQTERLGIERDKNRRLGAGPQMNAFQAYSLQQQQAFDKARTAVISELEAGKINPAEAQRRLNLLAMKFGSPRSESRPTPQVNPEIMKAMLDEYKNIPQMTPQLESQFRRKWGPAAEAVLGKDPMADAAAAAFGGQGQSPAGIRAPQGQGQQVDPVVLELQQKIRDAAVQGNAELVQQLNAGLQAYVSGRRPQGNGLMPPQRFGGFGQ